MSITILDSTTVDGTLLISSIANSATDTDKFVVSDGGVLKYRTGTQVRSDIGAGTGNGSVTSVAVSAGTGLSGGGTVTTSGTISLALDLGELVIGGTLVGTDYLIAENGGVDNRQLVSSIPLSIFNNNLGWTSNTGTVTSVATSLPLTGGTITGTGTIGINQASALADGYLSSTDWTIFNNKSNTVGTVTSVGGTGTVSGLTLSGTVTSSGNLTLGGTLALTSANVTTALGYTPYNSTNPSGYTTNTGTVTSVGVAAGTGMSGGGTVTTSGSVTLTNSDRGSSQNIFKNVAVSGQTSIVADSNNDTLTFAAGNNITLSTNATTDTVTITANINPGDITGVTASAPLTGGGTSGTVTVGIQQSSALADGYLSSADWTTFNNKTSNTGTVTSVGGTGTVSGLTLSGTVTGSGNLTLGGTLALTSANVTGALGYTPYNSTNPSGFTNNTGTVTRVGISHAGNAFTAGNEVTTLGTLAITMAGTAAQYINGQGDLVAFPSIPQGDITAVVAGTGLSGGGTSGSVTLTNAAPNVSTNLSTVTAVDSVTVVSSDGTNATISAAIDGAAGVMTSGDRIKLDGIAVGATNVTNNNQLTNGAGYTTNVGDITGVTAGTGISGGGTSGTVTITNSDRGSSQNIFKNVAVLGQTTVVADSNNDTLTFAAGNNITLTTNVLTDTVTITANINPGDITGVTASTGLSGGGTSGDVTLSIDSTVATLTGTQTFTNKSGNISQWTNDSGYTTNTGTTTASNTQTFTNKSGNISQWTNDSGYITSYVNTTYTAGTGLTLVGTEFRNSAPNVVQTTVSGNAGSATVLQTARTIAGVSFNGSADISLNNNAITNGAGYITSYVNTTYTAGAGITLTGTVFSNAAPNIVQTTISGNAGSATKLQTARTIAGVSFNGTANISLNNNAITNGAGYTTNTGTTTASNAQTFTNKGGAISQWTNDSGYITSYVNTTYTAGTGLALVGTVFSNTAPNIVQTTVSGNAGSATALQTSRRIAGVFFNGTADISLDNGAIANGAGYTTNTGTTTPSSTETFTNKSGAISQWTNDSGYTTNAGDITGVSAGTGITGGGTSGTVTITNSDRGSSQNIFKNIGVLGQSSIVADSNNDTLTFVAGSNITLTTDPLTDALTITANINPGDITGVIAGTGMSGGGTSGSVTLNCDITNNNQLTNGAGYTTNTGTTTASNAQTFTNKSGNISQWTNNSGYITSYVNTTYTAGTGLTLVGTEFRNSAPDTGVPAILSNGSFPSLNSGITAAEVRVLIGAGTSSTTGTVTSVGIVAGTGMSGGGTITSSGSVTLNCTIDSPSEVGLGNLSSNGNSLSGNFTATGNITAYSDERLKTDVETIPNALEKVNSLRGVTYTKDGVRGLGVIAQEVEKIIPEVVIDGEEFKSVAYGNIVGLLIEAIKELTDEVAELKRQMK